MKENIMPKVSFIMTVYNGEAHLREAIDSIILQPKKDNLMQIKERTNT